MSTSNNRDNFEQSQLRLYSQELLIVKISLNNTLKNNKNTTVTAIYLVWLTYQSLTETFIK